MDVMFYAFALTAIRAEFSLSAAAAGGLASVTLLTSAVGGHRVRGPRRPHRPGPGAGVVDPDVLRVHGAHRDGALPRGARPVAVARRDRPRRGVGRRVGAGLGELAGRAPRQGDRPDAVGVGDRLHLRRAARLRDPARPRLAGAVRHRRGARAAGVVGAAERGGAGDLAARRAERSARIHGAVPAAAAAQRPASRRRSRRVCCSRTGACSPGSRRTWRARWPPAGRGSGWCAPRGGSCRCRSARSSGTCCSASSRTASAAGPSS